MLQVESIKDGIQIKTPSLGFCILLYFGESISANSWTSVIYSHMSYDCDKHMSTTSTM